MVTPVLRLWRRKKLFEECKKNCLCKKSRNLVDSHPSNFSLSQNSVFFKGWLPYHSIPLTVPLWCRDRLYEWCGKWKWLVIQKGRHHYEKQGSMGFFLSKWVWIWRATTTRCSVNFQRFQSRVRVTQKYPSSSWVHSIQMPLSNVCGLSNGMIHA